MSLINVVRPLRTKKMNVTCFYVIVILIGAPFCTIVFYSNEAGGWMGDVSLQDELLQLSKRLRDVEDVNRNRMTDIITLRQDVGLAFRSSNNKRNRINKYSASKNGSVYVGRETLWQKHILPHQGIVPTNNRDSLMDLQLPTLKDYLPHLNYFDGLKPALKIAASRTGVTLVFGIPTVKRPVQGYLVPTLQNLIDNMDDQEKDDSLIIVCIAERDKAYVEKEAEEISNRFSNHIESGLLEVIAPPHNYYPDFKSLRNTLGDPMDRVRWRTKQNLDYAYLMMYAQAKGTFYVQLEDDILTKPRYITKMKTFAYKQLRENKDWIVLDFCQLGFIGEKEISKYCSIHEGTEARLFIIICGGICGKMFKAVDLSKLVTFFAIFHNDKPVDWLLDHLIQTKVCRFDRDRKDCKKQKDAVWIHYRPSLFQHVGTHSSLKGKVQKLKDKQFGKTSVHYPHRNPPAELKTSLKTYRTHGLIRAYKGDAFFWSRRPVKGDNITFHFSPPVLIERYYFHTGNTEHPDDILLNASVQIRPALPPKIPDLIPYPSTWDNYLVVGNFLENPGIAEGAVVPTVGPVSLLRIQVEEDSDHWLVINEIVIETVPAESLLASAFNFSSPISPRPQDSENTTDTLMT